VAQPTNRSLLGLRPKPKNRGDDFEAQITKPELSVLRPKPGKTAVSSFEAKLEKTVTTGFEAKPVKTVRVVLRPNHSHTVDLGFEAQPRNPRS
jgi:hypothetical protein